MRKRYLALVLVVLVASAPMALATAARVWVQSVADDFATGEFEGVSMDADGVLTIGPARALLDDTGAARVWALAVEGDRVLVAAGEGGIVTEILDGERRELFRTPEGNVHSIAVGGDGRVLVGTGNPGRVYRLDSGGGTQLADLSAGYVWALLADGDGVLAATGNPSRLVRVAADGTQTVLLDGLEAHFTSLARTGDGSVIVGSESPGRIYRVDGEGRSFVLHESDLSEITAVVADAGAVWAAAYGVATAAAPGSDSATTPGSRASARTAAKGRVIRIDPAGYVETMWNSDTSGAHALLRYDEGVVVGTSGNGSLVHIGVDGTTRLLARLEDDAVVLLRAAPQGFIAATSNGGRIYSVGGSAATDGVFRSAVRDTGTTSTWGSVRWRASPTGVNISTRSGNTSTPNGSWSDWSPSYDDAAGSMISSPPARFVQWRAQFAAAGGGASAELRRIEIVYVPQNLEPQIAAFRVHPPGVVYRQNASFEDSLPFGQLPASVEAAVREMDSATAPTSAGAGRAFLGRPLYIPGLLTLSWEATDPNGDELAYELEFRGEDEVLWKPLAPPVDTGLYVFDTARLPDGNYLARLTASDAASNPSGDARRALRESRVFVVDNTAPVFTALTATAEGDRIRVRARISDASSIVRQLRYSVDGADWRTVLPVDGAADAATEELDFFVGPLGGGEHTLVVQAIDAALNHGAGRQVVQVE